MLPKTTIEQRSRFYEDVESLLSPGFLTHPVTVAGVRLQLRSLSPGDLFMLRARATGTADKEWRIWALATSIWMIDGQVTLGADSTVPLIAKYLRSLPASALATVFSVLLGLFARSHRAVQAMLAYNYESESRYKWASMGRGTAQFFGVPGAERLGLNTVQQMWLAFNQYEDQRAISDQNWEAAKLVASTNAPKAVKKLDEKDHQRHLDEQERRLKALDIFYYSRLGLVDEKGARQAAGLVHRISGPKSVEDLEDEMKRWVTGDADLHDTVVSEYKNRIRLQKEYDAADLAARQHALRTERARLDAEALEGDYKPQPLLALSAAQLQQMLQGRGGAGGRTTFIPTAPHADRLYSKYLAEGSVTAGDLQVQGDKVLDPGANPEVDARTLNELIKGRSPTFGSGGE